MGMGEGEQHLKNLTKETQKHSALGDWLAKTSPIPPNETNSYYRFIRAFGWCFCATIIFITALSHIYPSGYRD
ncbi:MAG: hypothetical protein U5N55_13665, partial [Cypionkella sp.]|nr:hypothetical protein [Cypionkella sp.]